MLSKKILSFVFLIWFSNNTVFAQDQKNEVSLQEMITFLENRNSENIDKILEEKDWIYVSSDKHGTTQVDMWMFEIYYHDVQFVLMSIFSPEKGIEKNQIQLHFQKREAFENVVAQLVDYNFVKIKEEKKDNVFVSRYGSPSYFLYTVMDRSQRLPYRITLAKTENK